MESKADNVLEYFIHIDEKRVTGSRWIALDVQRGAHQNEAGKGDGRSVAVV